MDCVFYNCLYAWFILGQFTKAARLCPKVCGQDVKRWEDWIFVFAQNRHLQVIHPCSLASLANCWAVDYSFRSYRGTTT